MAHQVEVGGDGVTMSFVLGFGIGLIIGVVMVLSLVWYFDPTRGCDS